jgi:hypothetical protein
VRTCYDSTAANDIPLDAGMVGGYVDGKWKWSLADWQRFPNAVHVPIACFPGTNDGVVGDVETGDMLPWELPDWVLMRRKAGVDPTGYVNLSNWNPTRTEFHLRGIPEPHWWLADYDDIRQLPVGAVAKQYANSALSGGHYDLSMVADFWPGIDKGDTMTQAEFDALLAGNPSFQALIWRTKAIIDNLPAVENGPTKGEPNALHTALGVGNATKFNGTIEGTIS